MMPGARDSAASTKLSDDDLAGVAGGVEQGLGGDADIIDTARDLSLALTPNLGYYIHDIENSIHKINSVFKGHKFKMAEKEDLEVNIDNVDSQTVLLDCRSETNHV